jgi:hypothetical protein
MVEVKKFDRDFVEKAGEILVSRKCEYKGINLLDSPILPLPQNLN